MEVHRASRFEASQLVLVALPAAGPVPERGASPAPAFPGAAYAPYADRSHAWNPLGSGVDRARHALPVALLQGGAVADAARRAAANAEQVLDGSHVWQRMGFGQQPLAGRPHVLRLADGGLSSRESLACELGTL